jgi:uncharacterized phage-associated protein
MGEQFTPAFAIPPTGFRSRKAAQACAFFAAKTAHGIEKLKLIKLMYLAERKHLGEKHKPILWDDFFSLPHGPICSGTLNGIDGRITQNIWNNFIARHGNVAVATRRFERSDLDELSNSDIRTLESIWVEFGHCTASQLRNYTHDNCPEYTETDRQRIPISYLDILVALGDENASSVAEEIISMRRAESVLTL